MAVGTAGGMEGIGMARKSRKSPYLLNKDIEEPVAATAVNTEQMVETLPTGA